MPDNPMAKRHQKHQAAMGRMGSGRSWGAGPGPSQPEKPFVPPWASDPTLLPKKPPGHKVGSQDGGR